MFFLYDAKSNLTKKMELLSRQKCGIIDLVKKNKFKNGQILKYYFLSQS